MDAREMADDSPSQTTSSRAPRWDLPLPKGRHEKGYEPTDLADESPEEQQDLLQEGVKPFFWRRAWRVSAALVAVSGFAAVLAVGSRADGLGWRQRMPRPMMRDVSRLPLSQKWLPTKQEQVLSFKKWMKAWHVVPGELTPVIYHTYSHHPQFIQESAAKTELIRWQIAHQCPQQLVGYSIEPASPGLTLDAYLTRSEKNVSSAAQCQYSCSEEEDCTAWVYAATGIWAKNCWRKSIADGKFRYLENKEVISGEPCSKDVRPYWWPNNDQDLYNLPLPPPQGKRLEPMHCLGQLDMKSCSSDMARYMWHMPWPLSVLRHGEDMRCCAPAEIGNVADSCPQDFSPIRTGNECGGYDAGEIGCCPYEEVEGQKTDTMHCVMLFLPYTPEQELVLMQYQMEVGIFRCDSWALYSSQAIELAAGVVSRRVHSNLMCEVGGQFITALNLGIFLALYRQILLDQDFLSAEWLVKVDPDTVWAPTRLRHYLREHSWGIGGDGIYFNNCEEGLHGPIEVFSKNAFISVGRAAQRCKAAYDQQECSDNCTGVWEQTKYCNGPCIQWWGEDIWVDQCLTDFTNAKRVMVKTLLQEDHCKPQLANWRSCTDPHTVAFHPFKDPWEFKQCSMTMSAMTTT